MYGPPNFALPFFLPNNSLILVAQLWVKSHVPPLDPLNTQPSTLMRRLALSTCSLPPTVVKSHGQHYMICFKTQSVTVPFQYDKSTNADQVDASLLTIYLVSMVMSIRMLAKLSTRRILLDFPMSQRSI